MIGWDARLVRRDAAVSKASAQAAALAALAEAGIAFLIVRFLLFQAVVATRGPLATYPAFVVLFTAATYGATYFRDSRRTSAAVIVGAVAVGIGQGLLTADRSFGVLLSIVLAGLAGVRILSLAVRDWRNPVTMSFGVGSVILLLMILSSNTVHSGWDAIFPAVVPLFFFGSLGSRALSVRLAERMASTDDGEADPGRETSERSRASFGLLAALVGAVAVGVFLGFPGGALDRLGRLMYPVAVLLVTVVAWIMSQLARGGVWLLAKLHFNLQEGLRRLLDRLLRNGTGGRARVNPHPGPPPELERLIGLAVLVLAAWLVLWYLRRRREPLEEAALPRMRSDAERATLSASRARGPAGRRAPRRELPSQAVRRWYAETLLLLERKGLPRPTSGTPAEFAVTVGRAFPESEGGFRALTAAYEGVRYGDRRIDRAELAEIRSRHDEVVATLRRARPPGDDGDAEGAAARPPNGGSPR